MKKEFKTFKPIDLKFDDEQGTFSAVFATMNVVDADGDLTIPGAFGKQDVVIGAYAHNSWYGELPVGKGSIHEEGDLAIVEGQFFLDTENGKNTYGVVKGMKELQEWSYSLPEIDYEYREEDGESIRILKRIVVNEVSPCLMGSGIDTRTLDVKSEKGLKLLDHLEKVLEDSKKVTERILQIKEMREKNGKHISKVIMEKANVLADILSNTLKELKLLQAITPVVNELQKEFLNYQKTLYEQGVSNECTD